ncbi:MAG: phosphoribosyltransferase family protein [Thermoguttaceae bacterium]|jgi:ComF family protein
MPRLFFQLESLTSRLKPVWPAVHHLGRGLLNLALPPRCLRCDEDLSPQAEISFCLKCTQAIAPELGECCNRCGAVLPENFAPAEDCPACKDFSLKFDAVYPLGRYQGALRELVLKTKRLSAEALSLSIGRLLAQRLGEKLVRFRADAVLPIPMHWAKRLLRGVNSPELLADCLGRKLGVPVVRNLVRCRYTGPQKDLLPRERFRNVRGAFRLRRSDRQRRQGSRLLLVDDILTTGATCSEVARLLKQSGAAAVAVAVVARADGS